MEQNIPHVRQPVGKTFVVAITVLGIIALIQIIAAGIKLWPQHWPAASGTTEKPFAPITVNTSQPKPAVSSAADEAERLIAAATALERKGDNEGTLNLLEEADGYVPNKPQVIAKMATLLEQLDKKQSAAVQWKRLVDMGKDAGEYRKLASGQYAKLAGETADANPSVDSSGFREDTGLQPGSSLGIVECRFMDDTPGQRNLRLALKSRPGVKINPKDVDISISFYEKVDGEITPVPKENAFSDWISTPINWSDDNLEILMIHYRKPPATPKDSSDPVREYYGYMVTIYHKNLLQDFSTEPGRLREMFPPKINIKSE